MHNKKKSAFVSWGRYIGRSQGFIDNLIMEPIYIKRKLASKYLLPFDYGLRFIETLFLLNQCKPKFVLVMTPPIFAAAAVFLFSTLHKTPFMLDNHSGSFESSKWKWSLPILRFLSKKAKYAIVTNSVHYDLLRNWGAKPLIMSDPPPIIPKVQSLDDKSLKLKHPSVVVVNTYSKNEAIDVVVEAAKQIEGINFYITGDKSKADPTLLQGLPENIILTGWLSLNDFWFIMKNCNLIMTLIDQENTILRGGWEAMYLGQPLITTGTSALRSYFYKGAVFVEHSALDIKLKTEMGLRIENELRSEMVKLRSEKIEEWVVSKEILLSDFT